MLVVVGGRARASAAVLAVVLLLAFFVAVAALVVALHHSGVWGGVVEHRHELRYEANITVPSCADRVCVHVGGDRSVVVTAPCGPTPQASGGGRGSVSVCVEIDGRFMGCTSVVLPATLCYRVEPGPHRVAVVVG